MQKSLYFTCFFLTLFHQMAKCRSIVVSVICCYGAPIHKNHETDTQSSSLKLFGIIGSFTFWSYTCVCVCACFVGSKLQATWSFSLNWKTSGRGSLEFSPCNSNTNTLSIVSLLSPLPGKRETEWILFRFAYYTGIAPPTCQLYSRFLSLFALQSRFRKKSLFWVTVHWEE